MNDRFKFRVFLKYNQIMCDIDSYCFLQGLNKCVFHFTNGGQKTLKNDDFVLMQSTGLRDKNKNLIYEGDIVNQIYEDETTYKCEVVYNNCSFQLKHIEDKNKNYINTPMYCYAINYLGHYTEKRLEVIGNIYKNKELLND